MAKKKVQSAKTTKSAPAKKKSAPRKAVVVVETLLKVGQKAPAFSVCDESGELISSKDLKGKTLVIYFYPKDHTPGCTQESCDFRDSMDRIKKAGALVFGVSRDSVSSHLKFKTKLELPFSLLADEEGKMCEAFGVWKEKSMYGRKYMGIERSTFIIDQAGKIARIYPKVSVTGHVDQVIEDLKELK